MKKDDFTHRIYYNAPFPLKLDTSELLRADLQSLPSPSHFVPFRLRIGPRMRTSAQQKGWSGRVLSAGGGARVGGEGSG
jgi:hypothetical protein